MFKKISYNIRKFATHKNSFYLLNFISFIESIFFPIPPDVILLPMCLYDKKKILKYVISCTISSVLGGVIAYFLGMYAFEIIRENIQNLDLFTLEAFYQKWGMLAVLIGGFTPVPFKIITVTSGVLKFNFIIFIISSFIARGLRFAIEGGLIYFFADQGIEIIKKYKKMIFLFIPIFIVFFIIKFNHG